MLQAAVLHPALKGVGRLRVSGAVVEDDEPFDTNPLHKNVRIVGRPRHRPDGIVHGDQPARGDPCVQVHLAEHCIQNRPARVIEIHIDPVRAGRPKRSRKLCGLVIDRCVEREFFRDPGALRIRSSQAYDAATDDLGYLSHYGANCPGSSRDNDRLPGLGFANVDQPKICRGPDNRQNTESVSKRQIIRPVEFRDCAAVTHLIVRPAPEAADNVSRLDPRLAALQHSSADQSAHHFAKSHRFHVLIHVAHPNPVGRIERQVKKFIEELTIGKRR